MLQTLATAQSSSYPSRALEPLTTTQQAAADSAMRAIGLAPFVLLEGAPGSGKTTVLRALWEQTGGAWLDMRQVMAVGEAYDTGSYEKSIHEMLNAAFDTHDLAYFDDGAFLQTVGRLNNYVRHGVLVAVMQALKDRLVRERKTLIVSENALPAAHRALALASGATWSDKAVSVPIGGMKQDDLKQLAERYLGVGRACSINFDKLYQFSHGLGGASIVSMFRAAAERGFTQPSTDQLMEILSSQIIRSNVKVEEVEKIDLNQLVGVDDLIDRLDRSILLPLRDPELAKELGLKAKHGVLLHGPPGTGKTTIGRALAHLMKGRFFMIDGDFMHDGPGFYEEIDALFLEAKRNNPSVIFIDDADVILADAGMQHFGRYLLTKLDGLESLSAGETCVMMTAMDVNSMPPALLRSGRLEVWLETRAPAEADRATMLESYFSRLRIRVEGIDFTEAAKRTEGFTAADMRRLADDVLGYVALEQEGEIRAAGHLAYFDRAVSAIKAQKAALGH